MRQAALAILVLGWVLVLPAAGGEGPQAQPAAGAVILGPSSYWRWHFTWKTGLVRRASGELEFGDVNWGTKPASFMKVLKPTGSEPPVAGWAAPGFDDGAWTRARAPMMPGIITRRVALISARAKFKVVDPARAGNLDFTLVYRGGAVIYLNGEEMARANLPEQKLEWDTPAEDYSPEAYLAPDGFNLRWAGFGDPQKYKDRFALRERKLEVMIPATKLRKGINVIAVKLHRAPAAEAMFAGKFREEVYYAQWDQVGLQEARLTAPADAAVVPNSERPKGFQVWTQPVLMDVYNVDFADPLDPPAPVEIRGARNGAFSGQVVTSSTGPIRGLKVAVTDLKGAGGQVLPAAAVQVRYALLRGEPEAYGSPLRRFEGLAEEPPAEVAADKAAGGAVAPVWITAHLPGDARAGDYTGRITVSAEGAQPVEVPLGLKVADWALPDPKEFVTFIGFIQSPESLAIQYKVDMWSEAHWKLIDRSFEILGRIGTKDVYVPIRARTYFGNEHSMVRWVKQPDGSWKHDFSIVEKYLDTAIRHLGRVPAVVAYAWDVDSCSSYFGGGKSTANLGLPFTVLDPATGKLENQAGPKWAEPAMREFLKPVFDGLRKVLAERGLEKSLMVGVCGDLRPSREVVEDLKAVAPEAGWMVSSHSYPTTIHGQHLGCASLVWGMAIAPDPADKRVYGWKNPELQVIHPRYGSSVLGQEMTLRSPLGVYRIAAEAVLTSGGLAGRGSGLRGVGRCGADFWPVLAGKSGYVVGRYPETSAWHGGNIVGESYPYALWPGKAGAIATTRFEMLREGVQDEEARIFLEKVLTDQARRAKLGEDLARRCQDLLDERVRANRQAIENCVPRSGGGSRLTWTWFAGSGWQQRTGKLYELAAEAAGRTGGK